MLHVMYVSVEALRADCVPVSKALVTSQSIVKSQNQSLLINKGQDVVLCGECRRTIKHDLGSVQEPVKRLLLEPVVRWETQNNTVDKVCTYKKSLHN